MDIFGPSFETGSRRQAVSIPGFSRLSFQNKEISLISCKDRIGNHQDAAIDAHTANPFGHFPIFISFSPFNRGRRCHHSVLRRKPRNRDPGGSLSEERRYQHIAELRGAGKGERRE